MDGVREVLEQFGVATREWFNAAFAAPTAAQAGAWRAIGNRAQRPRGRADRLRQDAGRVPVVARPAVPRARPGGPETPMPGALRQPAQGARGRRGAQPARAADRHPAGGRAARPAAAGHHRRHAHRRHPGRRAAQLRPDPAGHPDHHARVAVPDPHLGGPRVAARRGDGDHRRGARGRRHQARRPPGAVAGAAGRAADQAGPAGRAVRDRAPDRRDRPVPRRLARRGDRAAAQRQDHRGAGPGAGRGHDPARRGAGRRSRRSGRRPAQPVDLAGRGGARPRPDRGAPLDDRLHQLAARGRAAVRADQRAGVRAGQPARPADPRTRRTRGCRPR